MKVKLNEIVEVLRLVTDPSIRPCVTDDQVVQLVESLFRLIYGEK